MRVEWEKLIFYKGTLGDFTDTPAVAPWVISTGQRNSCSTLLLLPSTFFSEHLTLSPVLRLPIAKKECLRWVCTWNITGYPQSGVMMSSLYPNIHWSTKSTHVKLGSYNLRAESVALIFPPQKVNFFAWDYWYLLSPSLSPFLFSSGLRD